MNNRIKELERQADEYADGLGLAGDEWCDAQSTKFAELIVKECSKVITNGGYWHHITEGWSQATPPEIAKMVREHFGIEE